MGVPIGVGLFGKVDEVPRVGYIATRFFHVAWIPLVPLSSHVVEWGGNPWGKWQGVPIPMHSKSLLTAWFRGLLALLLYVALILTAVYGIRAYGSMEVQLTPFATAAGLSALVVVLYAASRVFARPTGEQAGRIMATLLNAMRPRTV